MFTAIRRAALGAALLGTVGVPVAAPATAREPTARLDGDPPVHLELAPERIDALRSKLACFCEEFHVPGMAIVVVVDDKVVLAEGLGERDREARQPVTADTLFQIGSTTKAFTSALIATLVDGGVLNWDNRVSALLPGFRLSDPEAAEECTLRDLLSHRTGVMRTDLTWFSGTAPPPALVDAFGKAEPTAKFRSAWQYNNNGYLAAGLAAATAAHRADGAVPAGTVATTGAWAELVGKRLFGPLGMTRTTAVHAQALADPDRAVGYELAPSDDPKAPRETRPFRAARLRDLTNIAPAGAIWSSANDMGRWLRFQLARGRIDGRRIVSQERMDEMWQPQIAVGARVEAGGAAPPSEGPGGASYALGWLLSTYRGNRLVTHDGRIDGFTTTVAMLPDLGVGYAAMINLGEAVATMHLPGLVFGTLLGVDAAQAAAPTEDFAPLLGKYRADMLHSEFTVLVKDGKLAVDVPGQTVYELRPPDADGKRFFAITDEIAVRFERDPGGEVNRMRLFQAGLEFELPKLGATFIPEVTRADVGDLVGVYHDPRLGRNVTIRIDAEGRLAMDVPGQMAFQLKRGDEKDRWDFRLLPRTWLLFNRNGEGTVVSVTASQNGTRTDLPRVADAPSDVPLTTTTALDDLLRRHDEAHGFAALRAAGDVRATGTARFVNQGIVGTFTTLLRGSDRVVHDVEFPPYGFVRIAARRDGATSAGEMETAFDGFLALDGPRLARTRLASAMPLATMDRSALASIELMSIDGPADARIAKLRLVGVGGPGGAAPEAFLYIDEKTGLAKRLEGTTEIVLAEPVPFTIAFEDYREVAGGRIPHRVVTDSPLFGRLVETIDAVEAHATVADAEWSLAAKGG